MPIYQITQLPSFSAHGRPLYETAEKSKRLVVLTVKGKAAAVVQDAEAYQHLLDIAAQGDAKEGIRQGLENAKEGKLRPARRFFDEFEAAHAYLVNITLYRSTMASENAAAILSPQPSRTFSAIARQKAVHQLYQVRKSQAKSPKQKTKSPAQNRARPMILKAKIS